MNPHGTMPAFEVAKKLGISLAEVRLLVREGRLCVTAIGDGKYGKELWFSREEVEKLAAVMPEVKKSWQNKRTLNRPKGNTTVSLASMIKVRKVRYQEEDFLESLNLMPERMAVLPRAAYYLFHLNHYAKAGHQHLYMLKGQVLRTMTRNFGVEDGLSAGFVDGGSRVLLCPSCRREANALGQDYKTYILAAGKCKKCREDHHYYSLFEFRVTAGDHSFTFHSPYPVCCKWFGSHEGLPSRPREPVEREDGFSFGRPILVAEARAIPLDKVVAELQVFIRNEERQNAAPRETR